MSCLPTLLRSRQNEQSTELPLYAKEEPVCHSDRNRSMLVSDGEMVYTNSWTSKVSLSSCIPAATKWAEDTEENMRRVIAMIRDMPRRHAMHLLCICSSYLLVLLFQRVSQEMADSNVFQALGLLIALWLAVRAKRAWDQSRKLRQSIVDWGHAAYKLLLMIPEAGPKDGPCPRSMHTNLLNFCRNEVSQFVQYEPGNRKYTWEHLPKDFQEEALVLCAKCSLNVSPKPLLHAVRQRFLQFSTSGRLRKSFEEEVQTLFGTLDLLLLFRESYDPTVLRLMETVAFIYLLLYPWVTSNASWLALGVTTMSLAGLFYGLLGFANSLEDPMLHKERGFNLTHAFNKAFEELDRFEMARSSAATHLRGYRKPDEPISEELHRDYMKPFEAEPIV